MKELIKEDPHGKILLVGAEPHAPYRRPPLSKDLWLSKDPEVATKLEYPVGRTMMSMMFETEDSMANQYPNVTFVSGMPVKTLDAEGQSLELEDGTKVQYDQCILATGARPRMLPCLAGADDKVMAHSMPYRTIEDFQKIDKLSAEGKDIVVVGGGYLGTELSNALNFRSKEFGRNQHARKGKKQRQITQVIPEPGVLYRFLPLYLSDYAANRMAVHGVDMRTNTLVTGVEWVPPQPKKAVAVSMEADGSVSPIDDHGKEEVFDATDGHLLVELTVRTLSQMRRGPGSAQVGWADIRKYTIKSDLLVYAVGVTPNDDLARSNGIEIDEKHGGIIANSKLEVAKNLYATGDTVSYFDPLLGRRRMEHYDHAQMTGQHAARNAARDAQKPYTHLSNFWSELLDLGIEFEAVGNISSQLPTVGFWDIGKTVYDVPSDGVPAFVNNEYNKGVVYYLSPEKDKVVGVLMWNLSGELGKARKCLQSAQTLTDPIIDLRHFIKPEGCKLDSVMVSN